MRIGALTMVRAGSVQKTAAKSLPILKAAPTVQPRAVSVARSLAPQTPNVPGFAPGTVMALDWRAGAGQVSERTYEPVETAAPAPVTTGAAQSLRDGTEPKQNSLALPAILAAALYFMG